MKKRLYLLLILLFYSCSGSDDDINLGVNPISSISESSSDDSDASNDEEEEEVDQNDEEVDDNDFEEDDSTEEELDLSLIQGSSDPSTCSTFIGLGPDIDWIKSVEGSMEEAHAHFIYTTSDNGYIQVGETGFLSDNTAKILVVKTDINGDLVWKKEFGEQGHNLGNSILEIGDGYIISGSINKNSTILKLDKSNGNVIWQNTIDNGGTNALEQVVETPNGLVGVGYIKAEDENNTFYTEGQGYITFFDLKGNKISGKLLNDQMSHAYRVLLLNDNLIVSGLTAGAEDYSLMKISLNGDVDWIKTYGGIDMDHCFAMDIGEGNSIFLSGHTLSGTQNWDTYTMKIDLNGNKIWENKRGNPRGCNPQFIHDEVWDLKATPDGGCIIVAGTGDEYTYSESCEGSIDKSDTWHVYLIKFNSEGDIEWDKTYYDSVGADWAGEAIDLTSDGGAIIAVDNSLFGFLKIAPFL